MKKLTLILSLIFICLCSFDVCAADSLSLKYPKTVSINTKASIKANMECSYKSSNPSILSVSKTGKITAKKPGVVKVTVVAKKNADLKRILTIRVDKKLVVTGDDKGYVYFNKAGLKKTLKCNLPCTFTSANKKVATISKNGVIRAISPGKAQITIKSKKYGNVRKIGVIVKGKQSPLEPDTTTDVPNEPSITPTRPEQDVCSHDFSVQTTASTCSSFGKTVSTCKKCGLTKTKTLEKTPHDFGDWVKGEENENYIKISRTCKICGHVQNGLDIKF